jgi:hypothetical protein
MSKKLICLFSFVLLLSLAGNASAELVAHWKFDGNFEDSSGKVHDGTPNGDPAFVPGRFGQALELTGSPQYVNCGTGVSFTTVGDGGAAEGYTISVWINPYNPGGDCKICGDLDDPGWGAAGGFKLALYQTRIESDVRDSSGRFFSRDATEPDGLALDGNTWYHVAAVYDDAGDTYTEYINGEVSRSVSVTQGVAASTVEFLIGTDTPSPRYYYNGLLDDLRIYDSALSEQEILGVMQGGGVSYPFASRPAPSDGALHENTWVNLSWSPGDSTVSHDVYLGDNFEDVNDGTPESSGFQSNQAAAFFVAGFPGFPYPDGLVPGTTYYWRIDEVNDTEPNSPWKGSVWSFSVPPKTAYYPDPSDAAEQVDPDANISWTAGFGAKLHTVYFGDNFDDVNNAAGGLPQGAVTYDPGTLKLSETYYWRVDEFDAIETYKGNVWSFTTQGAVGSPDPANGAVDIKQTQIITFSPSVFAASHQVYFGTDKDAVKNADTGSPEYKGTRDLGAESYDPGMLEWDTTYYWRIDEVNSPNPDSPWPGILWSFTTANFLIVDDFESYNDIDPPDPESNRIFEAWLDGYGIPTNGALVGNDLPPYAEQSIVHSGIQSMPYFYDNSVGYSEATLTLTYPRDWTEKGVNKLTIWFRGDSANAAETLYVALNGSAVVNHDNPNAAQVEEWTEWNIDLQAFADQGVNLANVNTIALGLGNKNNPQAGGSGTMYFDDIRLYPPPPEPTP